MKSISIVVPTYNEEKNIKDIYERITGLFNNELKNYELQLLFIDNFSQDATRMLIEELAERDKRVQAIFNASNFGFTKSTFYGLRWPPWTDTGRGGLCSAYICGYAGPAGGDTAVCKGMGKRI